MYGDESRGSGRTTSQMKELPTGSVYLVATREEKDYCKRLQHDVLKRSDIVILLPNEVWDYGQGKFITAFDVDHELQSSMMNREQRHRLEAAIKFLNARKPQ